MEDKAWLVENLDLPWLGPLTSDPLPSTLQSQRSCIQGVEEEVFSCLIQINKYLLGTYCSPAEVQASPVRDYITFCLKSSSSLSLSVKGNKKPLSPHALAPGTSSRASQPGHTGLSS